MSVTSSAPTVVLHLGAHKTATTHLQHSLIAQRIPLWQRGIRTMMPPHLRGGGQSLEALFDLPIKRSVTGHAPDPAQVRDKLVGRAKRFVVSEENFLGVLQTRQGRVRLPLYPRARERLGMLIPVLSPERGVDLCFAIRDPAGFLNSAYGQVMMAGHVIASDQFKKQQPLGAVDWVDVITRLRATPGVNRLTIWCYEDYLSVFDQICHRMLGGCDLPVAPLPQAIHGGLSRTAVARVLGAEPGRKVDPVEARQTWPVGPDHPPFNAFTAEELALSREFYTAQVDQILAMAGVDLLRP
ncbi:hypothetical protein [Loktanella sp. R86503]|uniref:hypothetical protein n=1 Tax=Loktanella sp. R86503 TaxID=3093847 RepID=UPI0036DDC23C